MATTRRTRTTRSDVASLPAREKVGDCFGARGGRMRRKYPTLAARRMRAARPVPPLRGEGRVGAGGGCVQPDLAVRRRTVGVLRSSIPFPKGKGQAPR